MEDKDHVDADKGCVVHVTPAYPPGCKHEWKYVATSDAHGRVVDEEPSHCIKCGMSFTRYIFTECP